MAELKTPSLPSPAEAAKQPVNPAAKLSGRQKAAILLVSLGPERASQLFGHLRDDEIEALTLEMAKLRSIDVDTTEAVLGEAMEMTAAMNFIGTGGFEYARDVLEKSLGAVRAAEIMGRLSAVIEARPFEFLRRTPPEQIVAFLRNEAPQTMALVIANLHT